MIMRNRKTQSGFTTIELVLLVVIIGVLGALLISTRAGVRQNNRDAERQHDIQELRDGLEGNFASNNHYPTLGELNDTAWRSAHMKTVDPDAFRDPNSSSGEFADKPAKNIYSYSVTSASGAPCGTAEVPCTQYTLTATLEGGGTYTKNNLN
jgi:type II secretory pathway pseudopilin PulG